MRLHLPDLHETWPIAKAVNPHGPAVGIESLAWIESFHLFNEEQTEEFSKIKADVLASYAYPTHSAEQLRLGCDLLNLLFATDEVTDVLGKVEAAKLAQSIIVNAK